MTRGQLQKMQADLARAAGMGAALAAAAGWWGLDALLGQLAQRAAAGARPELHPLMQARRTMPWQSGSWGRCVDSAAIIVVAVSMVKHVWMGWIMSVLRAPVAL